MSKRCLVVDCSGRVHFEQYSNRTDIYRLIGRHCCNFEMLHLYLEGRPVGAMYCDGHGKLLGHPVNAYATYVAHMMGGLHAADYLVGDVMVVGTGDDAGNETDIPKQTEEFVRTLLQEVVR
jgi:hypothetical protein